MNQNLPNLPPPGAPLPAPDTARRVARRQLWAEAWRGTGWVLLAFALLVGVLLAAGERAAWHLTTLRSEALQTTLAAARAEPANPQQVVLARELDRLVRQHYFGSLQSRHTGVLLLVAGLLGALGAFSLAGRLAATIADPRLGATPNPARSDRIAQRVVLATSFAILLAALGLRWSQPAGPGGKLGLPAAVPPVATTNAPAAAQPAPPPSTEPQPAGSSTTNPAAGWAGFRGPLGLGVAATTNAPLAWDGPSGRNIRWKTPLEGAGGFNAPVVWNGLLFLSAADATERAVLAFDADTGAQRWRTVIPPGQPGGELPEVTDDTGLAAPTLATDGQLVFALFATGDLAALDQAGRIVWQVDLGRASISYGPASSLLCHAGRLFVQWDRLEGGFVRALATATGQTLWEVARAAGPSWCSPVLVPDGQSSYWLVLNATELITAHDPATGQQVWSFEGVSGEVAPSPAADVGRLFVAQEYARLVAVQLGGGEPAQLWEGHDNLPDVASPVAAHGRLWVASSGGVVACYRGEDGTLLWEHAFDQGFYASPIVCGGRLYALDRTGTMQVLGGGDTFELLASNTLGEDAVATPAFVDGRIFIRGAKHLFCIEDPDGPSNIEH